MSARKLRKDPPEFDVLTERQRRFVRAYAVSANATNAALKAKYKNPTSQGARMLTFVKVQAALAAYTKPILMEQQITVERVLREVARLALFDARKLFNGDGSPKGIHALDDDTAAAIMGLDVVSVGNAELGVGQVLKYKLPDKNAALDKLMRRLRLYDDAQDDSSVVSAIAESVRRKLGLA